MPESIPTAFGRLQANYKFQTSNYVMYIYDHILTFPEEVEKIWSQPFTFATLLFYINRYITHCQFIILQVAFFETSWSISMCNRYVKFAGAATMSLITIAELIMILRVYALYLGNKLVLAFLLSILSGQVIVIAWGIHFGERVPQPPGFPGCVLTGSSTWFAALWGAPLVTDTSIFLLTLFRALRYRRDGQGHMSTMQIILRDGTVYFFAIFSVNLMNTLIYFLAPIDLGAVGASVSQILTSILISRLQLNLRRPKTPTTDRYVVDSNMRSSRRPLAGSKGSGGGWHEDHRDHTATGTFFTIGNLGEELQGTFFDDTKDPRDSDDISLELVDHKSRTMRV